MTTGTLISLQDYPHSKHLEDLRCDECGARVSRYWIPEADTSFYVARGEETEHCCYSCDDSSEEE
jgi:hypothetical protein